MRVSAAKTLDLLFYLAREGRSTLTKIATDLAIDKATALRYLRVLYDKGLVEKSLGSWHLGLALFHLGAGLPLHHLLKEKVRPHIEKLSAQSGETVNFAIFQGTGAILLDRCEADQSQKQRALPGDRLPLYCTGLGRAMLSLFPEEKISLYLGTKILPKINHNTLTEPHDILEAIGKVRESGFSFDNEEFELGLICIARPIKLPGENRTAAISISGPSKRMQQSLHQHRCCSLLRQAAADIQAALDGKLEGQLEATESQNGIS